MSSNQLRAYRVWDAPTRLFHWINLFCFICLAAIGTAILYNKALGVSTDGKILLKTIHVWIGYVFVINLFVRLFWAFVSNNYARWNQLHPFHRGYLKDLSSYVKGFFRTPPPSYLGHNPAGKAMVFILLLLLVIQSITGLILAGTDIYFPPFGHWIAKWIAAPGVDPAQLKPYDKSGIDPAQWDALRTMRAPVIQIHYWVFYTLIGAVAVHVASVVLTELRERGSIVSAMIHGKKVLDSEPVDKS